MLPTFIVAGAGKSGTTALWEYLKAHPEVCMASIKEPYFFSQEGPSGRFSKGLNWYQGLWKDCQGQKAFGEITPAYMVRSDTPALIHKTIPNVRLIFVLRDPVDRIYSLYWFSRQGGEPLPDFPLFFQERHPKLERFIYTSSYQIHLNRYLDVFPREQIQVLLYDDMGQDLAAFMRRVYAYIGVNPNFMPPNLGQRYNVRRGAIYPQLQRRVRRLGPKIMRLDMPEWLFNLLKQSRKTFWSMNTRRIDYPPMPPEIRSALVSELAKTIDFIEMYLERPLPTWRHIESRGH